MKDAPIIGVDLAKNVFQLHGAGGPRIVMFLRKLSRLQFEGFMSGHRPCIVAMEACAGAHTTPRELVRHGQRVRLIPPHYVKPFLEMQKNDAADAEAIVEAGSIQPCASPGRNRQTSRLARSPSALASSV